MRHRTIRQNITALVISVIVSFWSMSVFGATNHLNQLNCNPGEIAKFNGTDWVCAPDEDTADTDTNAGTLCELGEYLDGDGDCYAIPADVETCGDGEALLGDGTTCVDVAGMQAQIAALQSVIVQQACGAGQDFVDLGLTVVACAANLEWEKKTPDNHGGLFTWAGAGAYIAGLNNDKFAGHDDWRLASVVPLLGTGGTGPELETILDLTLGECGAGVGLCIDPIFGPTSIEGVNIPGAYWSGVTFSNVTNQAWYVRFEDPPGAEPQIGHAFKGNLLGVRAVRDFPGP